MQLHPLLMSLRTSQQVPLTSFQAYLAAIHQHFDYTPTAFYNGDLYNEAGTNEGACQIFTLGLFMQLDEKQLLHAFSEHYQHVLATPQGSDHPNIRQFMRTGWAGIRFMGNALTPKLPE